jgi:uncharacterized membrane protein YhaH (DUF805 family)
MTEQEGRTRRRNRFILWFFLAGAIVPVIFTTIGFLFLSDTQSEPSDPLRLYWVILISVLWPTWILLFDAEHAREIVIVLLFACPINGAIYALVGLLSWHIREWRKNVLLRRRNERHGL